MQISLDQLSDLRRAGTPRGITSVCSAHPIVLRAALRHGSRTGSTVLIEATSNQVNHRGGYTGMAPADFARTVDQIAEEEGCPRDRIILGGDHLGPNPWRDSPAEIAMAEAETMVGAYVEAGFRKLHLDASMGCAGEPAALDDEATAERAVRLAVAAERAAEAAGGDLPRYIIGTEVPPPGGADHALDALSPTDPEAAQRTFEVHGDRFLGAGLANAFSRVIGMVVQPGVEFGNQNVIRYDRSAAGRLIAVLDDEPGLVFEAHSTDYQGTGPLAELVEDGFAILKVGPELTFALREALYALDLIASDLVLDYGERPLMRVMEALMSERPDHWRRHYDGDHETRRWLRHYSLSDRIRYYWPEPGPRRAVEHLLTTLRGRRVPLPIMRQHMPEASGFADTPLDPEEVLIASVGRVLDSYQAACRA